jgi:hypothetical protein
VYSAAVKRDSVVVLDYHASALVLVSNSVVPLEVESPIVSLKLLHLLPLDSVVLRSVRRRWIVRIRAVRPLVEGLWGRVVAKGGRLVLSRCSMLVGLDRGGYRLLCRRHFRKGGDSGGWKLHERWWS